MDIKPGIEKVAWSLVEVSDDMQKRYGLGPFKVKRVSYRSRDNCAPGTHPHVTVELSGGKPGTFCGRFFLPA